MNVQPFNAQAKWLSITVPNGFASTAIQLPAQGSVISIKNVGAGLCYFAIGNSSVQATAPGTTTNTATSTSIPVMAGEDCCYSIPNDQQYYISTYGAAATTLLVAVGEGQ